MLGRSSASCKIERICSFLKALWHFLKTFCVRSVIFSTIRESEGFVLTGRCLNSS